MTFQFFSVASVFLILSTNLPRSYRCSSPRLPGAHCPRILGGEPANIEDFPFMAYLLRKRIFDGKLTSCGACYIERHWLVTAGHCVYESNPKRPYHLTYVFMGMTKKSSRVELWVQKRIAAEVYHHPNYRKGARPYTGYDIGLIKIRLPFVITHYVRVANLPYTTLNYRGVEVTAIGWGRIFPNSSLKPDNLQMLRTKVWDTPPATCSAVSANAICIGTKKLHGSFGDSGGPLVHNDLVIGVLSRGCRNIYENIYEHIKWLDFVMSGSNVTLRRLSIRFSGARVNTRHRITTITLLSLGSYYFSLWYF
ncbi:hypothetical protein Trydic_g2761 [Trypoxylus dichotomus]